MNENRVLSFVPFLPQLPTHTKTVDIFDSADDRAKPVTSSPTTDSYRPRRWELNLIKLSGKNRSINEFSIEKVRNLRYKPYT